MATLGCRFADSQRTLCNCFNPADSRGRSLQPVRMLYCPPRSACPARLRAPLDPPPSFVAPSSLLSPVGGGALWLAGPSPGHAPLPDTPIPPGPPGRQMSPACLTVPAGGDDYWSGTVVWHNVMLTVRPCD